MSARRSVEVGQQELVLHCDCGWSGTETEITDWDVQRSLDRVVRVCRGCDEPIPEWGTFRPISAVVRIAKGPLLKTLREEDVSHPPVEG